MQHSVDFFSRGFSHHDATLGRVFCTSGNYVGFSSLGAFHIRMQHSVEFFGTSVNVTLRNLMKSVARLNASSETHIFHSKLSCVPVMGTAIENLAKEVVKYTNPRKSEARNLEEALMTGECSSNHCHPPSP
jgi:hypothetical protein